MNYFPIMKVGNIFHPFSGSLNGRVQLILKEVDIDYPLRLDAMAINPAAVAYNQEMIFTPGEVVFSIKKFIKIRVRVINDSEGKLIVSETTKRKVLVKHAYLLMCKALNISPSLSIDVLNELPKHCGFGSSSSTIAGVAVAINELYGNPISSNDLIEYLATNHGEEVSDDDEENLKVVQCIGGGATNGMLESGIIILAGKATPIVSMKYDGDILIGIPSDFVPKNAKLLMELEEKNLWKFKQTGEQYAKEIAYRFLHQVLPDMVKGRIQSLADVIYDYRFHMGSNENCSFVYDGLVELGNQLSELYRSGNCNLLALSSVGPAYFVLVNSESQKRVCIERMKALHMNVIETAICNTKYIVNDFINQENFWQRETTNILFQQKAPSKYITDLLDQFDVSSMNCIDIGCGGGRYTMYLKDRGANVLAIDRYPQMIGDVKQKGINFVTAEMDKIPVRDESYDLVLSIGVLHNAVTKEEYHRALSEIYRILARNGKVILSVFTNDLITEDLYEYDCDLYSTFNRLPMVLLAKDQLKSYLKQVGFGFFQVIDEHVTDVWTGKRNVYTVLLQK